jgi:hypothetical protein
VRSTARDTLERGLGQALAQDYGGVQQDVRMLPRRLGRGGAGRERLASLFMRQQLPRPIHRKGHTSSCVSVRFTREMRCCTMSGAFPGAPTTVAAAERNHL